MLVIFFTNHQQLTVNHHTLGDVLVHLAGKDKPTEQRENSAPQHFFKGLLTISLCHKMPVGCSLSQLLCRKREVERCVQTLEIDNKLFRKEGRNYSFSDYVKCGVRIPQIFTYILSLREMIPHMFPKVVHPVEDWAAIIKRILFKTPTVPHLPSHHLTHLGVLAELMPQTGEPTREDCIVLNQKSAFAFMFSLRPDFLIVSKR